MKKRVRRLKLILIVICVVLFVIYVANKVTLNKSLDQTIPEITFGSDVLEVSSEVSKEDLMKDVTATDKKDGDVTDSLIIESISNMLNDNERVITYAAFDKDNHVGKAERTIKYTDYTPPKFSLDEPFAPARTDADMSEILKPLHAKDCIDGDITDGIVIVNSSYDWNDPDATDMRLDVQVTNSSGDVAQIMVYVPIQKESDTSVSAGGTIELKEYLTYVKAGKTFNPKAYLESASISGVDIDKDDVEIEANVDTNTPGTYQVKYTVRPEMAYEEDATATTETEGKSKKSKNEEDVKTTVVLQVVVTE